jgi:hypothetical protein
MDPGPLDLIPVWGIFAGTVAVILFSVMAGLYLGRWKRKRAADQAEGPIGAVVGATLGLLAFILAFTFGMSANRFDTRRELLLTDVNAIGTTFLRAGVLPEPHKGDVRDLLKKYVDNRVEMTSHFDNIKPLLAESENLQDRIWAHAEALANEDLKNPDIVSLFVDALNTMIDVHTARVTALSYRIPVIIWAALYILTVFSMMGVGYLFGLHGRGNLVIVAVMSVSFASVVMLNVDLDNPGAGWMKVNQKPLYNLQAKIADVVK